MKKTLISLASLTAGALAGGIATANAQGASANIRLRWNYRPDSDLYVIYTAGQKFASLAATIPAQFYENRFAIKFTYSWQPRGTV